MTYQPAVGVWKETPARRLLWAAKQVLLRLSYVEPEQPEIDKWALRLEKAITKPVLAFKWERWYRQNVEKADDPQVPDDLDHAFDDVPAKIVELYGQAGALRTSALGLPFDEEDMQKGLESTMHQVKNVPDSTRDALRGAMKDALENSEGPAGFAKRIKQDWREFGVRKAEQIAVTEWNRAASVATLKSYEKQGVEYIRWFTAGDNRVCSVCEGNSAEGDVPLKTGFGSGIDQPPAHPGCRCNISSA